LCGTAIIAERCASIRLSTPSGPDATRDQAQLAGSGTPIVLVHGLINDYRAWNAQFNVFSETHRVIAVSLRHFYPERWDGIGTDFSVEQHAEDVAALIKKTSLGKVHLVGHSRGGAVVIEVAKSHPEVIRTLVLEDASIKMPVPETAETKEAAEFDKMVIGTLQENLKTGDPIKAAEVYIDMSAAPGTWPTLPQPVKEMIVDNIYTPLADNGRPRPLTSCADVKKFDFPVLLMTAEKSPKIYEFFYNEMRKCKNDLPPSIVIPNAGHPMQRHNPEAFNKATLAFVSQH
jgi:pimeloyl-ACP methyl ester carboxylesterase